VKPGTALAKALECTKNLQQFYKKKLLAMTTNSMLRG